MYYILYVIYNSQEGKMGMKIRKQRGEFTGQEKEGAIAKHFDRLDPMNKRPIWVQLRA